MFQVTCFQSDIFSNDLVQAIYLTESIAEASRTVTKWMGRLGIKFESFHVTTNMNIHGFAITNEVLSTNPL
jgi:hypothetical protein